MTKVEVENSDRTEVRVFIDGRPAPNAQTTLAVVKQILNRVAGNFRVKVEHRCQVPVGAGYGASGAGALGTAFSLAQALGLRFSRAQLVAAAHVAEVLCYTGLGDVGAQAFGGLVIGIEPGAPPFGRWRRIRVPRGVKVVCATLGPIPSKDLLSEAEFRSRAREKGTLALNKVLARPDILTFISASKEFAENLGLLDGELMDLIRTAEKSGAVGASQVMIGRAVFALARGENVDLVRRSFSEALAPESVMVADIYLDG
ncbi:MAG: pantoate kinase [Candidatus Hadarchaeum sp.]|uniref:GHMP family kinase ATP-binding protein n=1 Tax=Candidatus Hadarchaeum sp. TaxID=2883567 RepID=UPI003D0A9D22